MATQLNYDPQGFIVGIGRVENNTKQLHNDTQEILRLLTAQRNAGNDSLQDMNQTLENIHTSLDRLPASLNRGRTREYSPRRSTRPASTPRIQRTTREYGGNNPRPRNRTTTLDNSQSSRNPTFDRQRDAGGRFTAKAEDAKFVDKLSNKLGDTFGKHFDVDDKNLDPLIDSFHEMKDALSPISGVLGFIRDKAEQRRERKHDKAVEDNLEAIAENTGGGGGNGGGRGSGFLGGMAGRMMGGLAGSALGGIGGMAIGALGGIAKGGTKLLKGGGKLLGPLATIIGAGSLAMDWGNLDHEGKSAGVGGLVGGAGGAMAGAATGAAIGSVVPVIGTAIGGVAGGLIGGWLGSEGGEVLGKTASPYIQSWTQSLTSANIPKKLSDTFSSGLAPFFAGATKVWDWVKGKASSVGTALTTNADGSRNFVGQTVDGVKSAYDYVANGDWKVDFGNGLTKLKDGMTYKMGAKGLNGATIDCSGWVDAVNKDVANQVGKQLGSDAAKKVRINAAGGAAGIIQTEEQKGHLVTEAGGMQDLDINKLQAGMIIGQSRGSHAASRYKGIGHIGSIIEENGVKYFSESTSAKGADGKTGVQKTELNEYIKKLNGRRFGVSVVDPYKEYRSQLTGSLGGSTGGTGVASSGMARRGNKMEKANNTHAYDAEMANAYNRKGFDPETQRILKAQIWQESGINANTKKSRPGAAGIAQFMPATAQRFGVDVHSTSSSFKGQAEYMDFLLKRYKGNMKNALMAYNMGEGNMDAYLKTGKITRGRSLPKETENYANDILANKNSFSLSRQDIPQSVKLQALAATKKGMTPANVPAPPKPKIPKPPVVTQKVSSDDNDDDKKSGWLSSLGLGGLIAQNVSDRGIAHAVTGGLGEDRWWG